MKTFGSVMGPIVLCAVALLGAGCIEKPPPPGRIGHYLRSEKSVLRLHRAVFITLDNRKGTPQIADETTEALIYAIQRRQLFHIDTVVPTDAACEDLPLKVREAYSMKQLSQMREALKCDAVLVGSVNHWQPYPRLQIGLYVRLLDLRKGQPVWVVDHIWDSTDKETEARIKDFFRKEMRSGYDPAQWRLGVMSPKVFLKFVAYEAANTLPSRVKLQDPKKATFDLLGMLNPSKGSRKQGVFGNMFNPFERKLKP